MVTDACQPVEDIDKHLHLSFSYTSLKGFNFTLQSHQTPFHFASGGGICALQQLVSWELKMSWEVFVFV